MSGGEAGRAWAERRWKQAAPGRRRLPFGRTDRTDGDDREAFLIACAQLQVPDGEDDDRAYGLADEIRRGANERWRELQAPTLPAKQGD